MAAGDEVHSHFRQAFSLSPSRDMSDAADLILMKLEAMMSVLCS